MVEKKKENAAMPTDLKLKNRMTILDKFRESSEVTISEIMKSTGISRQTIVKSIDYFVNNNIIVSLGKGSSSDVGGKKPELYKFNEFFKYIICVRFQDYELIVALMDLKSNIISVNQKKHNNNEKLEVIIEDFKQLYKNVMDEAGVSNEDVYGVGICVSGICNPETGVMRYNSHYPSWGQDIEIVKNFKEVLPEHYEVMVSNEAKMTGMAELYYDKSLEEKDIVVIYTYEGIAYAHIVNGDINMGTNALVGEIGHMCIEPYSDVECQCGSHGCFEKVISEKRVIEMAKGNGEKFKNSALVCKKDLDLQCIFKCAEKNDAFSREIVAHLAKYFSIALRNIILNTDPELIIIQGIYSSSGTFFKKELDKNLVEFKYLPKDIEKIIKFDTRDVYRLALLGTSLALIKKLFEDTNIYKNL